MTDLLTPRVRSYVYSVLIALGPLSIFYGWITGDEWEMIERVIYAILMSGPAALAKANVEKAPDYNAD